MLNDLGELDISSVYITKEEILKANIVDRYSGKFKVDKVNFIEKNSKGDPMLMVSLNFKTDDKNCFCTKFLTLNEKSKKFTRQFFDNIGLTEMYDTKKIKLSEIQGKYGNGHFKAEENDKYGWQMVLVNYIMDDEKEDSKINEQNTENQDDDIPF